MLKLLIDFQDTLKVLLGAMVGIFGSVVAWHLQNQTHKKRQREELLLRATQLALHSLTYNRCITYAKFDQLKTLIDLPENPVDQLLAIVLIHFPSAFLITRKLHEQQQDLYAFSIVDSKAPDAVKELGEKMAETVTELVRELNEIAIKEKIGVNLVKKSEAKIR
jgi:hypothetical protein